MAKVFKIKGKEFRVIDEFLDMYLCISEVGFELKRIPKLTVIK